MDIPADRAAQGDPVIRSATDATALGMAYQIEAFADGSRRFTFVGQRCLAVSGVTAEAAMADPGLLYSLISPNHRAAFLAAEEEALARMMPFDIEVATHRPDGEVRWHRFAALPRPQPDGRVLWDGLQVDITEHRRVAQALEAQRLRLEVAIEATDLGLWELDLRANRLNWSSRNRALFGVATDVVVTLQDYLALVHPEDRDRVVAAFRGARDAPGGGDFAMEYRVVTAAGASRWILTRGRVLIDAAGPRTVVGTSLDTTERRNAEERGNLLVGELAHRWKNGIAVIMAMVVQTARGQKTVKGFEDLLMARLQAMAVSLDLATASGGRPIALLEVLTKTVSAFDLSRFDIDESLTDVTLRSEIGGGMGLLMHELATNAVKYGAFSRPEGRVRLIRVEAEHGAAAFAWQEIGGPLVKPSARQGFGTRLLQQVLRPGGGKVTPDFRPEGFHALVEFPTA